VGVGLIEQPQCSIATHFVEHVSIFWGDMEQIASTVMCRFNNDAHAKSTHSICRTKQGAGNSSNGDKLKGANTKKLMDQLPFSPTEADTGNGGTSPSKQKLESIRGCDWLQEISVTVRKNTKTNIPRDRWAGDTLYL